MWDSMVYDEETDTIYIGTGNGSPWPAWQRGKGTVRDNLYLSSIVALDAETGLARWHYQTTPGDSWDYTAAQHMILADLDWQGDQRKVIMQAPKNGFFYVLDRVTGELLSAEAYVPTTWASHVDMDTGRPVLTDNADYSESARVISPAAGGGHNWQPMSYSPKTGLVYIPAVFMAGKYLTVDDGLPYQPLSRNTRALHTAPHPEKDAQLLKDIASVKPAGLIIGWDVKAGEAAWTSTPQPPGAGGTLVTAGNLVFAGGSDGIFRIFNARTGDLVRSIEVGTSIMAAPMSYQLDGEQYVAVMAGWGGVGLRLFFPGIAPMKYQNSTRLLVFKLDGGEVSFPPLVEKAEIQPAAEDLPTDEATLTLGEKKFDRYCAACHSKRNLPNGFPNLWNISPPAEEMFDQIVLEGIYSYAGMASFADVLTPADTLAIRAWIADDRRKVEAGAEAGPAELH